MEKDVNEFTIDCFFSNSKKLDKKIFIYFYKYLGVIQDLQYILDLKQIDLSSHSNNLLNLVDINNDYKKIFNKNNIIDDLNLYKKKLYDMCYKFLGGMTNE